MGRPCVEPVIATRQMEGGEVCQQMMESSEGRLGGGTYSSGKERSTTSSGGWRSGDAQRGERGARSDMMDASMDGKDGGSNDARMNPSFK